MNHKHGSSMKNKIKYSETTLINDNLTNMCSTQICVQLPMYAENMALSAFAAVRHAVALCCCGLQPRSN